MTTISNLLILEATMPNLTTILNSVSENTQVIIYEKNDLKPFINENISSIGFMYMYRGFQQFPFLRETLEDSSFNLIEQSANVFTSQFMDFILYTKTISSNVVIDLITTNITNQVETDIQSLSSLLTTTIRYKTNNWIQESDSTNIKNIYFTNDIENWTNSLSGEITISEISGLFTQTTEYFDAKTRDVYTLNQNIIIDCSNNISWLNNKPWNRNNYILLGNNVILDGGDKTILVKGDYFNGLFVSNKSDLTTLEEAPILRNIRIQFENRETNYGSGIIKEGQKYIKCINYNRN
jgi:hypothetical protein